MYLSLFIYFFVLSQDYGPLDFIFLKIHIHRVILQFDFLEIDLIFYWSSCCNYKCHPVHITVILEVDLDFTSFMGFLF